MKLSDIKPNPNNPRVIKDDRFHKLVKSIREFPKMMSLRPIVIDSKNIVLGGNMRLKAMQHLGFKEIPDDWVKKASELTTEEQKRFIIADNVGFGEYDWEMLANDWDSDKLEEWGVDLYDFNNIINDEDLLPGSNDRGGMLTDGLKIVLGNVTRFIKSSDDLYKEALLFNEKIINFTDDEITKLLCLIFKI